MPSRTRLPSPVTARAAADVSVVKPHPLAWKRARQLADGDVRRLVVLRDGSVLVLRAQG